MIWKDKRKKEIDVLFECLNKNMSLGREALTSKSRKKEFVLGRKIFFNLLFERFEEDKMNQEELSSILNKDRTTFIHQRNMHIHDYNKYKNYKRQYDELSAEYSNNLEIK